jgi:hypothetical protein
MEATVPTDIQFTATGQSAVGFQTTGNLIDVGADITGKSAGGKFHAGGDGPAISGDSMHGKGLIGGTDPQFNEHAGVYGESDQQGVYGRSSGAGGTGVYGNGAFAVRGESPNGSGFIGGTDPQFSQHAGVYGESDQQGVYGRSSGAGGTGVYGNGAFAVRGESPNGSGFIGGTDPQFSQHAGVYGESDQQGVTGIGTVAGSTGIYGSTKNGDGFGLRGETTSGTAIQGQSYGQGLAGRFVGNVEVTGDVLLSGADCAENFRVAPATAAEPGTVMVIQNDGLIRPCSREMDPTVAGVVSGAGGLKAAIVLDYQAGAETVPIAMIGKVFVKVDADVAAISAGDLLVTSSTLGHAMRLPPNLRDRSSTSGLILGKALAPLRAGQELIPMLVTLS